MEPLTIRYDNKFRNVTIQKLNVSLTRLNNEWLKERRNEKNKHAVLHVQSLSELVTKAILYTISKCFSFQCIIK
jgi:hypothetical protein